MSQQEYDELHRAATAHMSKKAFSCCSLEPKGEDDHNHEHRVKQPWEFTDGAIYIVRELCAVAPEAAVALLPMVADVAILRHFPQTGTLQETVWKQVPLMCDALGKRVFKQYLEVFLDPMVFTLQGSHPPGEVRGHRLCEPAEQGDRPEHLPRPSAGERRVARDHCARRADHQPVLALATVL
ncbi:hypothetical protein PINS_up020460 [Pythium insidiosum]|nr:hypothetical protein PINS_up020460 [Pythium insidiosum]